MTTARAPYRASSPLPHWRHCALAALAAVLAMTPGTVTAQVRLGGGSEGYFTVPVMSWWDIPFRTVVRQQFDFSCGSAAVATMLTYHYGRKTGEREAFMAMWSRGDKATIRKSGFSMLDMKVFLTQIGYQAEGFRISLDQLKSTRRPTIVLLDTRGYKHFVVVKGFRGDHVLVGDPALGLTEYPLAEFEKHWNGIALAVLKTPDSKRASFNLASDWGPWAKAPLDDDNDLRVPTSELTSFLPPAYQITPLLLLEVRVGTVQ